MAANAMSNLIGSLDVTVQRSLNGKGAIGGSASSQAIPQHDRIKTEEIMSQAKITSPDVRHSPASYNASTSLLLCPITGRPCEGDLAYLCEDYGCARKGGLSPRSDENF
jgi:hypothetical protein